MKIIALFEKENSQTRANQAYNTKDLVFDHFSVGPKEWDEASKKGFEELSLDVSDMYELVFVSDHPASIVALSVALGKADANRVNVA